MTLDRSEIDLRIRLMQDCKLVMLKAKIDKKTRPMQDSIKLNKNTSRCPSTPIPVLSEIFLSDIPLSIKEVCEKCKRSENNQESKQIPYTKQNVSGQGDQGDIFLTVSQAPTKSRSYHAYQRSISSTVEFSIPKRILRQRQLSLTDVSPGNDIQSAGDGYGAMKKRHHSPVMKMKFITEKMLLSNRIFLVESSHNTPCSVFSVLPYTKESQKLRSTIAAEVTKRMPMTGLEYQSTPGCLNAADFSSSQQVVSYHSLLEPSKHEPVVKLDTAKWISGKHRTVLALNSYRVSVIGYTKPSELKRDLNSQFKSSYPAVNITLSKLRSLERQMQRTAKTFGLQTGVLACAKMYFERLVFASLVNKTNRQQIAAACFLLSAKVHGDLKSQEVVQLISALEHSFKNSKHSFMSMEFLVFAALKFSLLPISVTKTRNASDELTS